MPVFVFRVKSGKSSSETLRTVYVELAMKKFAVSEWHNGSKKDGKLMKSLCV